MIITLLLDPHWGSFSSAVSQLFVIGFVLPLVLWMVLRLTGVLGDEESEDNEER
jgi:hypothetical protein